MKIRRDDAPPTNLNLTPMIDMLFILIIFFLATSRFQQDERDENIELVSTSNKSLPIATPSDLLVIDIDEEGRKKIHGIEKTLAEIEKIIRKRLDDNEDAEIVIRADRRSIVGHLFETTEICHRLGLEQPKITYSQD